MRALVLTISDRASAGEYDDRSGPAVEQVLRRAVDGIEIRRVVVSDDADEIERALTAGLDVDVILTCGGTGLGPRDLAPEVTARLCDREVPGVAELLRAESRVQTPNAALSRGTAGLRGGTLIVNLPGSVRGATFAAEVVAPLLGHAVRMIAGDGH